MNLGNNLPPANRKKEVSEESYSDLGSLSEADDQSEVGDWLEEKEEEQVIVESSDDDNENSENMRRGSKTLPDFENTEPLDPYLLEHKELYFALLAVPDLRFSSVSPSYQAELLATLEEQSYLPGQIIIAEDTEGGELYFITGPADAQVEVVKTVEGNPKLVTRLSAGQYFGMKHFISNRTVRRNATVNAITHVKVACLRPEYFLKWSHFRTFLLMKEVPMFRTLPMSEQLQMYGQLQHQEFQDREFIVQQGDSGDKFYMITEGAADVVEERDDENGEGRKSEVLTRLYEGHFFGEMALIYDEPRVASVIAVGRTTCLYLSKVAFREALSAQQFHIMMQEISYKRVLTREQRKITRELNVVKRVVEDDDSVGSGGDGCWASWTGSAVSDTNSIAKKVTTTNKLVRSRLSTGDRLINKYLVIKEIGRGTSGDVYLCKNEENGQFAAMKVISRPTNRWSASSATEIKTEINIMKTLRHENVVSLLEVIDDPSWKQVFLIQEYMQGGPILPGDIVTEPIPAVKARKYFRDMLKGIRYLHSQGIVHRDIKPQNMLRTADDIVKIADFGAAVFTGHGDEALAAGGTPAFMAPEMFHVGKTMIEKQKVNSPKVDVWSLGATLFNMIVGRPPWMAGNQLELAAKVQNIELSYPEDAQHLVDPHLRHLIKRMLDKDPSMRIDLQGVIEHDWVTSEGSQLLEESTSSPDNDLLFAQAVEELSSPEETTTTPAATADDRRRSRTVSSGRLSNVKPVKPPHEISDSDECSIVSGKESEDASNPSSQMSSSASNNHYASKRNSIDLTGAMAAAGLSKFNSSFRGSESNLNASKSSRISQGRASTDALHKIPLPATEVIYMKSGECSGGSSPRTSLSRENSTVMLPKSDITATTTTRTLTRTNDFVMVPSEVVLGPSGEKIKKTLIFTASKSDLETDAAALDPRAKSLKRTASITKNRKISSRSSFRGTPSPSGMAASPHSSSHSLILSATGSDASVNSSSMANKIKFQKSESLPLPRTISGAGSISSSSGSKPTGAHPHPHPHPNPPSHEPTKKAISNAIKKPSLASEEDEEVDGSSSSDNDGSSDSEGGGEGGGAVRNQSMGGRSSPKKGTGKKSQVESDDDDSDSDSDSDCESGGDSDSDSDSDEDSEDDDNHFFVEVESESGSDDSDILVSESGGGGEDSDESDDGSGSDSDSDDDMALDLIEAQSLDDVGMSLVFDDLCGSPQEVGKKEDPQLARPDIENVQDLFMLKTWAGQWNLAIGLRFGVAESIVDRDYMEDRTWTISSSHEQGRKRSSICRNPISTTNSFILDLNNSSSAPDNMPDLFSLIGATSPGSVPDEQCPDFAFFGIFDGHNGHYVSEALQSSLYPLFRTRLELAQSTGVSAADSLREACAQIDRAILGRDLEKQRLLKEERTDGGSGSTSKNRGGANIKETLSFAGSTAVVMVMLRERPPSSALISNRTSGALTTWEATWPLKLILASVGDCQAVLCDAGNAVALTTPHKPSTPSEKLRIEKAGGWVHRGRVNGVLAVSRSFGDIMYKNFPPEQNPDILEQDLSDVDDDETERLRKKVMTAQKISWAKGAGLWNPEQQVVSEPEIIELEVKPTYEFVVMGSDGLWDVLSPDECVNFVRRRLAEHGDCQRSAIELVAKAEGRGTSDNTSVVIVCLNQIERSNDSNNNKRRSIGSSTTGSVASPDSRAASICHPSLPPPRSPASPAPPSTPSPLQIRQAVNSLGDSLTRGRSPLEQNSNSNSNDSSNSSSSSNMNSKSQGIAGYQSLTGVGGGGGGGGGGGRDVGVAMPHQPQHGPSSLEKHRFKGKLGGMSSPSSGQSPASAPVSVPVPVTPKQPAVAILSKDGKLAVTSVDEDDDDDMWGDL